MGKITLAATAIVMVVIVVGVGGFFAAQGPPVTHSPATTYTAILQPSSTLTNQTSTATTLLASVENCTYTITSSISYNPYGSGPGPIVATGTTTTTTTYSTTVTAETTTGAVTTSTTILSYNETVSTVYNTGNSTPTIEITRSPDYIGEPYAVSCTYVK